MAEKGGASSPTPWWVMAVAALLGGLWLVMGPHGVARILDWLSRVGH